MMTDGDYYSRFNGYIYGFKFVIPMLANHSSESNFKQINRKFAQYECNLFMQTFPIFYANVSIVFQVLYDGFSGYK